MPEGLRTPATPGKLFRVFNRMALQGFGGVLAVAQRELVAAGALRGMGAAATGLVIATALKLAPTLRTNPMRLWPCASFVVVSLLAVGALRWPMVWVVPGLETATTAVLLMLRTRISPMWPIALGAAVGALGFAG